jgi:hypothetical protein
MSKKIHDSRVMDMFYLVLKLWSLESTMMVLPSVVSLMLDAREKSRGSEDIYICTLAWPSVWRKARGEKRDRPTGRLTD